MLGRAIVAVVGGQGSNRVDEIANELARARACGRHRARAAVLLTLNAGYAEARRQLDDVKLTDDDFPWLADILLEARCGAARRSGSPDETPLVEQFLRRQPLLFEPDHAFKFRLLDYQEVLKERYRQARRVSAETRV